MGFTTIWTILIVTSAVYMMITDTAGAVTQACFSGAQQAVTLCISMAGPLCLWNGLAGVLQRTGLLRPVQRLLAPLFSRLYPTSRQDPELREALTGNFCANLLGLGNAATPMGIRAVRRMRERSGSPAATDEMCRLVVMNTASVQLLPTTVAAIRAAQGAASPFDLLPCVWISSLLSVSAGLAAAALLGKVWRRA